MRHIFQSLFIVCGLSLSACAPEIGLNLSVPNLPEPSGVFESGTGGEALRVKVGTFRDSRSSPTIVVIDGRDVESEGALNSVVEEGLARYLREAGARIAIIDAPTIDGEITEWRARVTPSFPSSDAMAFARVKVTVRDTRSHPIYFASFAGEAKASHPLLDADSVRDLLAQAMGSALEAAVRDEEFLAQVAKGRVE